MLTLQSVETLRTVLPYCPDKSDIAAWRGLISKLQDGGFAGYKRDTDEAHMTRERIAGAGEGA
jgi:hypothetical protein